jgi:hypothetical protein
VGRPSRGQLVLIIAFLVAVAGAFHFGFRAGRHARHIRWASEPIRSWMSVPFVAHTYHVPPEVLFHAIGLQPHRHDRRPLRRIAREEGRPLPELIRDLEKAIANARKPPPPGP